MSLTSCHGQKTKSSAFDMKITEVENKKENNSKLKPELVINNKNVMDFKEKDYNAYVRSANCQFEILIDDVPPFVGFWGSITEKGTGFSGNIPINSCLLTSGKHTIRAKIYPKYGQTALEYMSFTTLDIYYKKAATIEEKFEVHLLQLEPPTKSGGTKGLESLPYYEMQAEINVDLPFAIEGWKNSVNLKEEQENGYDLKKELQSNYQTLSDLIQKKDTIALRNIIEEREDLLATAFYFTSKEKEEEIQDLMSIITDDNYELAPFPKEAKMYFYGYGKMVTLLNIEREGVIKFVNKKDPKETVSLEFRFHRKKKGDKLIVI
jgi:hypothetical protein